MIHEAIWWWAGYAVVCGPLPQSGKYTIIIAEGAYDQLVDYRLSLQCIGP